MKRKKYIYVILFFLLLVSGKAFSQTVGDTFQNPINVGTFGSSFNYSNTQNTANGFTNAYGGRPTSDVYYKFTTTTTMDMIFSHCNSYLSDTYLYLLDSSGNLINYNDDGGVCYYGYQSYLEINNLTAGTYYVVSKGYNTNGTIVTGISGTSLTPAALEGNNLSNPINAGVFNASFDYSDTKDTNNGFTNAYGGRSTNDVFYKFTTTVMMDIVISHCGSGVSDTYLYLLDSSGNLIASNDDGYYCSYKYQSRLATTELPSGTYYVVSKGYNENGSITTNVSGTPTTPQSPSGDTRETAINAGTFSSGFNYSDTKNTTSFTNQYNGQPSNDVFYKFVITVPMDIVASHCGSGVGDTYIHLLDASGNRIGYNDDTSSGCGTPSQAYLKMINLAAGTYYVVSEGYSQNGSITTTIAGTVQTPAQPGDTQAIAINAGTFSSGFTYTDTKNTSVGYTNQYNGQSTSDVFYKFTTTAIMNVVVSHCGSSLSNTYLHVLDSSGNRISYNDDNSSGCSANSAHAYLSMNNLAAGTYYVVSEGYSQNGSITTTIAGTVPTPAQPGDAQATAINAGTFGGSFSYTDTKNTSVGYTNQYNGQSTSDVFYKFTTTVALNVVISHCGSGLSNTYMHLLDASGNRISYNDDNSSGCSANSAHAYLAMSNLAAGTYYVVSEGYNANGSITTSITGSVIPVGITEPEDPSYSDPSIIASTDQNYVRTRVARAAVGPDYTQLTASNSLQTIQYFDGLGRPIETVQVAATPDKKDLVSYLQYDAFGREHISRLPVYLSGTSGSFQALNTVTSAASGSYNGDSRPYSETKYESSPLSRPLEAYGPGSAWSTHPVKTEYKTNSTSDVLLCGYYHLSGDNLAKTDNYPANQLYVTKMTDEDGNESYEFKDKLGHVVLQRQINEGQKHDTYYVYDDYGNLRYVLPPMGVYKSDEPGGNLTDAVNKYGYVYKYDNRNRCIEKKLPGAEPIYYVYDRADRLILSQDGVQRSEGKWAFNWYDGLGRLIVSGAKTFTPSSHSELRDLYANLVVMSDRGHSVHGYNNTLFMLTPESAVLQVNYYDDHNWIPDAALEYSSTRPLGYNQPYSSSKGMLTGSLSKTLDAQAKILYTTHYYDFKGNVVESHSKNILSGYDHEYIHYNHANEVKKKRQQHCNSSNQEPLPEEYSYDYDHAGRMKKKWYSFNNADSILIASYRYNNLGQLSKKYTAGVELTDYSYNIRGWMTGINGQKFSETLSYTNQYGGNIASINWNDNINGNQGYTFGYDNLGRMKQATYSGDSGRNYNESFTYDRNGNPLSTSRYGRTSDGAGNFSFGQIDALMHYYNGNQLTYIAESQANQYESDLMEVKKRLGSAEHYTYNANGNLTKDFNKNISSIQYNYLNLPSGLIFEDGKSISYVYDVSGVKHEVRHYNPYQNPVLQTTDYVGNKIYENNVLSKVLTEEGYLEKQGNAYLAYYYVKDHLGNNRLVLNEAGNVIQLTNYYPFGASFAEFQPRNDQEKQYYKYNGKELDKSHGLNMYDYGARMYDPAIGRFSTMDPLAEKYYSISPYAYCLNNPVRYIDPDGMSTHTDSLGNVVAVYDDGNLGIYRHNIDSESYDGSTLSADDGTLMGETLEWNSFLFEGDKNGNPLGKINFGSFEAGDLLFKKLYSNYISSNAGNLSKDQLLRLLEYALNAAPGEKYDIKSLGSSLEDWANYYRGSQISKGYYVSMRDAGNILAGMVAKQNGLTAEAAYTLFGALQLSGNKRVLMPFYYYKAKRMGESGSYGELPISHIFQKRGYEMKLTR